MKKAQARARRGLKTKALIAQSTGPRLVVFRSGSHIYSQISIREAQGDRVLVSCSTIDKAVRENLKGTKTEQAYEVGKVLAERAKALDLVSVAFDRSGYKYHGRVKALATGARDGGLDF